MKLLILILSKLPLKLRVLIGRVGGYFYSLIPSREKKIALLHLQLHFPEKNATKLTRQMFASLGQTFMETINLRPILKNLDSWVECKDWELAQRLRADPRPIVTLTAHTGNWDLLAAYMVKRNIPILTAGREARSKSMHTLMDSIRHSYGVETVWRSDKKGLLKIIRALDSHKIAAALIDQDTSVRSVFVDFFGISAKSPTGLIDIAKRKDAQVVATFIFRLPSGKYEVNIHPLNDKASVEDIILEYHKLLEAYIRRYPEQWVWFHKRWRSFPNGERMSTRNYLKYLEGKLSPNAQSLHA